MDRLDIVTTCAQLPRDRGREHLVEQQLQLPSAWRAARKAPWASSASRPYPYFLQLWGSELWDAADLAGVGRFTRKLLDATRPDIYDRLDSDFY